ncbi:APC family permease [Virgisporangium aurantiacum]|uniref:Amino acid permease n=1 Tax=Virgisporangium aurantiacum TaxID=175570 RepID=A0A8J3Z5P3_9ACTN|nr:APC family permease [Virgisporangium aurantiacum]GIJ56932.1 amino acid permease [Virgisporangium aurantiacum]
MTHDTRAAADSLRPGAIGTAGIVFFVVAAAAPLAATLGAAPLVFGANGIGAPGAYVAATVVLLLFAVGYATMSRHVTGAGGFATYISHGLGGAAGHAAAFVALLAYNCMLAGIVGQLGAFAQSTVDDKWGLDLPWQVWAFVGVAIVAVLGYRDVGLSARVLGVLLVAEVVVLLVMDVVVIVRGGASGLAFEAFDPTTVFDGAAGIAVMFAFSCFVGFEATTIYGEEARDPRRSVPRATYVAILAIGVFYTVTMFAIGTGYGAGDVADEARADPVGFVLSLNTRYVGSASTTVMELLVLTSLLAVVLAFHNTLSRYLYSLGRARVLPSPLGRTRRADQAPHVASAVQTGITAVIVTGFAVAGADPFLNLFAWLVGLGTLGVLVLQAATSVAVVVYFRRTRGDARPWQTLIAPTLALVGLTGAVYLVTRNFTVLTGVTSGPVLLLPWLIPVAALVGLAAWSRTRRTRL